MKKTEIFIILFSILSCGCSSKNTFNKITKISISDIKYIDAGSPLMSHVKSIKDKNKIKDVYDYINVEYELIELSFTDLITSNYPNYYGYMLFDVNDEELCSILLLDDYLYFTTEEIYPNTYCSI